MTGPPVVLGVEDRERRLGASAEISLYTVRSGRVVREEVSVQRPPAVR
ncbi:hypothetical protein ACIBFB_21505 [Nocardiopsis sp. NPDC050513]